MKETTRFNKGKNAGTIKCRGCGKGTWKEYEYTQCGLCNTCFDEAELENEHLDQGHEEPVAGCPLCEDNKRLNEQVAGFEEKSWTDMTPGEKNAHAAGIYTGQRGFGPAEDDNEEEVK